MVGRERPAHVLDVPRWNLALYVVSIVLAVAILGLAAWGVHWIAYNVLIFSLVVCIATLITATYMLVSYFSAPKIYNKWAALALHILLVIFWLVDLGLTANLASIWSSPSCSYSPYSGSSCDYYYYKRDLSKRQEGPTYGGYYGALAAGAFFCGVQFVLFVLLTVYLSLALHRHRGNSSSAAAEPVAGGPPPQYANTNNGQAVPLEKYNQTGAPQQQQQQQQPQQQPQYQQPQQPYQQIPQAQQSSLYTQQPHTTQYPPQNMAPRTDTVSPVSQVGYAQPGTPAAAPVHPNANYSELSSPQHTGATGYNPNVSELSSPQHTGYNGQASELSGQR